MAKTTKTANTNTEATAVKHGRKPVNPDETKAETFVRLANARTLKALTTIRLLGNLASAQYEKSPEQIDKMEQALLSEIQSTFQKLRKEKRTNKPTFSL